MLSFTTLFDILTMVVPYLTHFLFDYNINPLVIFGLLLLIVVYFLTHIHYYSSSAAPGAQLSAKELSAKGDLGKPNFYGTIESIQRVATLSMLTTYRNTLNMLPHYKKDEEPL